MTRAMQYAPEMYEPIPYEAAEANELQLRSMHWVSTSGLLPIGTVPCRKA